jgi:hypothetical protein
VTAVSENAKAFRNFMEGMVRENATSRRVIEESWQDAAKAADKSAKEISEKGQRLVERIRERADNMRKAEERAKLQEIAVDDDLDAEDVDPEVERFSQQLHSQRQSTAAAEEPAATTAESAQPEWQAQNERFGQPAAAPEPPRTAQEPNSGWNVQAGRFGRRNQQTTPPPAASPKPPPPKPAPRRQPVIDDDDDYQNQSWLR